MLIIDKQLYNIFIFMKLIEGKAAKQNRYICNRNITLAIIREIKLIFKDHNNLGNFETIYGEAKTLKS